METRASIKSHPIHPMLIVFPIGLWIFSFVCDLVYYSGLYDPFWKAMSFYAMLGGVIGALLAAIPGFIDYQGLTDRRIRRIAAMHMILNLVVLASFIFNLGLRANAPPDLGGLDTMLSAVTLVVLGFSGWLGGSLVYVHRVGVAERTTPRDQRREAA